MNQDQFLSKVPAVDESTFHLAWRRVSERTRFSIVGTDAMDLLHRLTTNALLDVKVGQGLQTALLSEKGRIIDVLTVLRTETGCWCFCNTDSLSQVVSWLKKYIIMDDARITFDADPLAILEISGTAAFQAVNDLFNVEVDALPTCHWVASEVAESPVSIVRMPTFREMAYYMVANNETIASIAAALKEQTLSIPELDEEWYEFQRILSGFPIAPNELNAKHNPLEAGLLHVVSFTKGCYIGQEIIARLESYNKVQRHLVGITSKHPIPKDSIIHYNGTEIGYVTSVTPATYLDKHVALCYVRAEQAVTNLDVDVTWNDESFLATIHRLPIKA